jgi:hypothetical protein
MLVSEHLAGCGDDLLTESLRGDGGVLHSGGNLYGHDPGGMCGREHVAGRGDKLLTESMRSDGGVLHSGRRLHGYDPRCLRGW